MKGNMVKVKNAYGDYNGLVHYNTRLIERTGEDSFIINPYYSASSCRAIDQWLEASGYCLRIGRKMGEYVAHVYRGEYQIERDGNKFIVKVIERGV